MPPLIMIAAYDSRLTIDQVIACNLVQLATPAAFAQNNFMMETRQILDSQGKMTPPGDYDPVCEEVYKELLPHADPPFTVFDLSLMSSTTTTLNFTSLCAIGAEEDPACASVSSFSWNSQFVTTQKSLPGTSVQSIWIDLGAVSRCPSNVAWVARSGEVRAVDVTSPDSSRLSAQVAIWPTPYVRLPGLTRTDCWCSAVVHLGCDSLHPALERAGGMASQHLQKMDSAVQPAIFGLKGFP